MAEETAVAETPPPSTEISTTLKDFGDLDKVFDKVFPATAQKKEAAPAEPGPEPAPIVPPAAEKEVPPEVKPPDVIQPKEELPDFLTGKKTEAPPPVDELPPPSPKESVGMKQLRTAYENLKRQAQTKEQEYTQKLEELQKAPPVAPDADATIRQLEQQVQELSAGLERSAIEFHPAFRAEFIDKRERLVGDAHQILAEAKVDAANWDRAMALTGTARTEALEQIYEELPRSTAAELGAAAREIRSLDSQRDAYLADRKGLRQRLEQESLREQRAALQQHEKNTIEMLGMAEKDLIDRMGMEVYKKSDNPEHKKWNDSVDRMKADARKLLLETTDPSVMARAALMAPAAIQYRYLYHTMKDRWMEAEKKLQAIEKAEPIVQGGGDTSSAPVNDKLTFAESVAKSVFGQ